jgi:FkbH-like protein
MLDDNPGEIALALAEIEMIDVLHASDDALITAGELHMFPGLFSFGVKDVDIKRAPDIIARQKRIKHKPSQSIEQYLADMETTLEIYLNECNNFERLCELPIKTNQFNLALQRLSEASVRQYLDEKLSFVVSFSLKDRLSNSGNVGALYSRMEDNMLVVDETCISCRALGRGIEDFMVAKGLETIINSLAVTPKVIRFQYRLGPRNQPAIEWLEKFAHIKMRATSDDIAGDSLELMAVDITYKLLIDHLKRIMKYPIKINNQTFIEHVNEY